MPLTDSSGNRLWTFVRIWLDALVYAFAVALRVGVSALILGIATGGGVVRAKLLLFVVGWVLLGYATVRLWPTSPGDAGTGSNRRPTKSLPESHDSTRFQAFVQALPPLRWIRSPPPEKRVTVPGKLLFGSILVLLLSFLMETVFGIS